jgi:two-component system response regulator CpxR
MEAPMTIAEPTDARRLLIVDDDVELCELVGRFLSAEGFAADAVHAGAIGLERALSGQHALVLLDVMLGRTNGFDLLRQIRAASQVPVVMLTAKGDAVDRIVGLEIGADDYLPKPFDPKELAARIRAILRRTGSRSPRPGRTAVCVGDLELESAARSVLRSGESVALTTVEFDLLDALVSAAGQVVSREALATRVLGRPFSPFDRSIDTHVYNLRRKLGLLPDGSERIVGVRGVGYLYACSSRSFSRSG